MQPDDVVRALIAALLGNQPTVTSNPAANNPATAPSAQNILQLVLNAFVAKKSAATPPATGQAQPVAGAGTSTTPAVLSPIDQWLGGNSMVGYKTALAVIAYAILSILQGVGVAGTATGTNATTTGQILTTLIGAFGGLGLTAKIDRVVQTLGAIASKPPSSS